METRTIQCEVGNIGGRGSERTAVATAAYLTGQTLTDASGKKWFYVDNQNKVQLSQLYHPNGSVVTKASERASYWSAVDQHARKRRHDARIAKSIMVVLPYELPPARFPSVCEALAAPFVAAGLGVEVVIHDDGTNPHCHLMVSAYAQTEDGFATKAYEPFRSRRFVHETRRQAVRVINEQLAAADISLTLTSHKTAKTNTSPKQVHRSANPVERTAFRQRAARKTERPPRLITPPKRAGGYASTRHQPIALKPLSRKQQSSQRSALTTIEPTPDEQRRYPNLSKLDHWPPRDTLEGHTLSFAARRELDQYRRDKTASNRVIGLPRNHSDTQTEQKVEQDRTRRRW